MSLIRKRMMRREATSALAGTFWLEAGLNGVVHGG